MGQLNGLELALDQLRKGRPAEHHIGQPHRTDPNYQPSQQIGEPGEAVHNHRRAAQQGSLQGGGTGGDQADIGSCQQVVGIASNQRHLQFAAGHLGQVALGNGGGLH